MSYAKYTLYTSRDLFAIKAPLCIEHYFSLTLATPSPQVLGPMRQDHWPGHSLRSLRTKQIFSFSTQNSMFIELTIQPMRKWNLVQSNKIVWYVHRWDKRQTVVLFLRAIDILLRSSEVVWAAKGTQVVHHVVHALNPLVEAEPLYSTLWFSTRTQVRLASAGK